MEQYVRNKNIIFRNLGDEGLALSTSQGEMTGVNATAAFILENLEEPHTVEQLHQKIQSSFDEPGPIDEVSNFLVKAIEDKLVQIYKAD